MRKSRFSEAQITGIIKEQEAGPLAVRLQHCQAALIIEQSNTR